MSGLNELRLHLLSRNTPLSLCFPLPRMCLNNGMCALGSPKHCNLESAKLWQPCCLTLCGNIYFQSLMMSKAVKSAPQAGNLPCKLAKDPSWDPSHSEIGHNTKMLIPECLFLALLFL